MDSVFIHGLEVEALLGVHPHERLLRQRVRLDLDMAWDNRPAARSEDLGLALDYQQVAERVCSWVIDGQFRLVETLAEQVAERLMSEFGVRGVRVRCCKPQALACAEGVGVSIERGSFADQGDPGGRNA